MNIFNSSNFALTNFMLHEKGSASTEVDKQEKSEIIPSTSTVSTATVATVAPDDKLKSRRRKLFRALNSEAELKEKLAAKLRKSNKLKFRKLFRHKDSSNSENKNTKILNNEQQKESPRKIIFRKNLIRGQRRRVPTLLNSNPLVKTSDKQAIPQKSRLFSRKRPPFGIKLIGSKVSSNFQSCP